MRGQRASQQDLDIESTLVTKTKLMIGHRYANISKIRTDAIQLRSSYQRGEATAVSALKTSQSSAASKFAAHG
jgi:hypothetical protein